MTDQLRSALQDLADTAPTAHVPDELWQQAQQSRRRRTTGAAALGAVFVLLTGFLVWGVVEAGPMSQASSPVDYSDSDLALPDEFSRPSPWEEGTADEGPLGPLAAVGTVDDRQVSWWRTEPSLFGISAVTGEYRYLDLQRMGEADDISLSPDGTKLAYWIEGEPTRLSREVRTVGYAVYDSVTGQTQFRDVAAAFGISEQSLAWTGDSADIIAYYRHWLRREGVSRGDSTEVFNSASSAVTPLRTPPWPFAQLCTWGWRSFAWFGERNLTVMGLDTGQRRTTRLSLSQWQAPVLSPDGHSVAVIAGFPQDGATYDRLGVYDAGDPETGEFDARTDVRAARGGRTALRVLGWADSDALLVEADGRLNDVLYSLDITTGVRVEVAQASRSGGVFLSQFARNLTNRPLVHREGPADKWDPRALAVVGCMLALGLAYVGWAQVDRRRKRDAADLFADSASLGEPGP